MSDQDIRSAATPPAFSAFGHTARLRDHTVHERPSTPLELLFDLCFVVAVAFLAAELHHGIAADHTGDALVTYLLLFIPIWWAWMSYSWFATAFSHDDALTRVLTFLQMGGILAVAAAIPSAAEGDPLPFTVAYTLMRLPLILQWVRSAIADPEHRAFALTYGGGSALAQLVWIASALAPGALRWALWAVALGLELATPMKAVSRTPDRVFHPGHIAERYGLFTIIVLGETVLAVSIGLGEVVDSHGAGVGVLLVVGSALTIAFHLWWLYFDALGAEALERNRAAAFVWGYGHYAIFAAIAAIGAGVRAEVDLFAGEASHHGDVHSSGSVVVIASTAVVLAALAVLRKVSNPDSGVAGLVLGAALLAGLAVVAGRADATVTLPIAAIVTVAMVAVARRLDD